MFNKRKIKNTLKGKIKAAATAVCFMSALGLGAGAANAVKFTHVCTSLAACDNDANFAFSITLDDAVVSASGSYDTTSDGGAALLGWTGASSVGDGFNIFGGFSDINSAPNGITFTFDAMAILDVIIDNSSGSILLFDALAGSISIREDRTFIIRTDKIPVGIFTTTGIATNWTVTPVPVPPALLLFGTGVVAMFGFGAANRRRRERQA